MASKSKVDYTRMWNALWLPLILFISSAVFSVVFIVLAKRLPDQTSVEHNFWQKMSDASSYVAAATLSSMVLVFAIELAGSEV